MSDKIFLPLPKGNEGFAQIRAKNRYYVDKTPYLKTVFSEEIPADGKTAVDGSSVLLFTRPRRFGKTLLMDMFESFLKINSINPGDTSIHNELFKDTKILEDKEFCKKYMGQFPVIFITLKDVFGDNFEDAYLKLAEVVTGKANEFNYLAQSSALNDDDKDTYAKLTSKSYLKKADSIAQSYTKSAIKDLALMLYKHFKKQVYILVDEYDVPLAKAQEKGYHEKMVTLMSSFLGYLKTPPKDPISGIYVINKVVMTGCLKVAKNSIFTGVNNLDVNTVISKNMDLTGIIGFTKEETLKALKDYEMEEYVEVVKNNYDGYRFCDKEMFCPWDVINFLKENYINNLNGHKELIEAGNYWAASTSSNAVYEYLGYLTDKDTQKMQDLVDGKSINFKLNDSMNYDCLSDHNSDDFWSLLLHTGYLTKEWNKPNNNTQIPDNSFDTEVRARIPNLEILNCFTKNIQDRFKNKIAPSSVAEKLANSFFDGDAESAAKTLINLLQNYVSIRDSATKAPHENFYHGFLNGLFANCSNNFFSEYHSNSECGDGYADIVFKNILGDKAVVIEIKSAKDGEDLVTLSEIAVSQIESKNYAQSFIQNRMTKSVLAFGIVFFKKLCYISVKRLKKDSL